MRTKEKPNFPVPKTVRVDANNTFRFLKHYKMDLIKTSITPTQHFADVRLDVDILQVLVSICMVESERAIEAYRHPHAVTYPR